MISQLGKYEIRRELARGAMGVVYDAYDLLIKRRVALKTIRPDQLEGERTADVIARFRREAQAAGRLSHPNIVPIYDFDEDNGTWFIAMEFVDGRELRECFAADERYRLPDIERIMTQILAALDYSHRHGVVHRDIKPANIFLLGDGTVKVADFGIAHIESSSLTQVGTVVGTPNYMSPEQIMGLPVDGRSDLFAAGVILYQFLTGERPFAGSSTTTMQKVLKEEPLAPSTLNVQLPPAIDAVVRKALAKRADDRFQSAQEFSVALRAAVHASTLGQAASIAGKDPDATMPNLAAIGADGATRVSSEEHGRGSPIAPIVGAPPTSPKRTVAVAIVAAVGVIGIAALAATWWLYPRGPTNPAIEAKAPAVEVAAVMTAATPAHASAVPATMEAVVTRPGTLVISAVGLADPSSPRYANDPSLLQSDVRADSQSQLVEKAVMLLLDRKSFASNYDLLESRVLSQSGNFISAVVHEGAPQIGKDGLMSMTTQAVVNVEAIRQSLDRMSREDRVQLIRASGDPRVAVRITVRDAVDANEPAQPSPVAENIVKERIRSFGFRTWSDASDAAAAQEPDFVVTGEASVRKLSTRLAASGLVITKYALAAWTVKCADRGTGEEIYFNTTLPKASGSWPSEEEALRAIGTKVADQFSRDFFLAHVPIRGRKVALIVTGLPDATTEALLARELIGLPRVITASAGPPATPRVYDVQMAPGAGGDAIVNDIVRPLNAKLGEACFGAGASDGDRVSITFAARCADGLRARLETNPPAGLYDASPARRKAVVKNPETLRKLMV
ncbi:MAG TPA: serine/threonine-protein kinase [Casimicrobiaceae bacterium]